jgi:hypothetical protein
VSLISIYLTFEVFCVPIVHVNLSRTLMIQITTTVLMLIFTVILPIISYIQFDTSADNLPSSLILRYRVVLTSMIGIGILMTCSRFFVFRYPKYSVRRGILNLLSFLLLLVYFEITAQLGKINAVMESASFSFDLTGVFYVLIGAWSLLVIKNMYDLYDFRKNERYYKQNART